MIMQDHRTPEQKITHLWAWGGTDAFLSRWRRAEGGSSYAFWAYPDGYRRQVESWVRSRSDMKRVRQIIIDGYRPKGRGHCHIYVIGVNHPALQ